MKSLQRLSLAVFLLGLGGFLSSFFWGGYQVQKEDLLKNMTEEKALRFYQEQYHILEKKYDFGFTLAQSLEKAMDDFNTKRITEYEITSRDIDLILNQSRSPFDTSAFHGLGAKKESVRYFKTKAMQIYGSWLQDKIFVDKPSLRASLEQVGSQVRSYEILPKKGFDVYEKDRLVYALTKASTQGLPRTHSLFFLCCIYGLCILGALGYFLPQIKTEGPAGIKNKGIFHSSMKNRGYLGILTGSILILFYLVLYFKPSYMTSWICMVDPLSRSLSGHEAGPFFLYGFLYTLCVGVMGLRMLIRYRHSPYQMLRTGSLIFFQLGFAFLIPEILLRLNQPYFDFKNIWPLDYDFFFDSELNKLIKNGGLGLFMLGWGMGLILLAVPILTYFFGKRWYCSWVCGCGGLAETLGDPYRQLSSKSLFSWKIERYSIHLVLVFAVVMTAGVLYTYWTEQSEYWGMNTYGIRKTYGFFIGSIFSGVVGTGFYPFMGSRVWCRFGCPLAAYLGLVQRFKSRFRITTNGGQCISCGNCSTYCEMGIDVRWYAQRGQNIIRSSCVGCGVCSSVCPRGVLNLENKTEKGRFDLSPNISAKLSQI
ncbi:MAG: 4Fe-4S binding protein [Cytophagales bacterium]|nr:4Fe-4S binding protein [Cytophagales bacterium]